MLDFFGIGRPTAAPEAASRQSKRATPYPATPTKARPASAAESSERFDTEIDVKVKSLSVVLNRPGYEVASVTAKNYTSKISLRDGNFAICGSLGNLSLKGKGESFFPKIELSFQKLD